MTYVSEVWCAFPRFRRSETHDTVDRARLWVRSEGANVVYDLARDLPEFGADFDRRHFDAAVGLRGRVTQSDGRIVARFRCDEYGLEEY